MIHSVWGATRKFPIGKSIQWARTKRLTDYRQRQRPFCGNKNVLQSLVIIHQSLDKQYAFSIDQGTHSTCRIMIRRSPELSIAYLFDKLTSLRWLLARLQSVDTDKVVVYRRFHPVGHCKHDSG